MTTSPSSAVAVLDGRGLSLWEIEDGLAEAVENYEQAREQMELSTTGPEETREANYQLLQQAELALKAYLAEEVRKVNGIAGYIRFCQAMKEEAERLAERAKLWAAREERLKAMTLNIMQEFGVPKYETATACLRRQKNGGSVPAVIVDASKVPSRFVRYTVQMTQATYDALPTNAKLAASIKHSEFMAASIRDAIARGEEIPGAQAGERGEHLRIA